MKRNRDKTGPFAVLRRRTLLGGALIAGLAALLPRRFRQSRKTGRRRPGRTPWIGHY